MNNHKDKVLKFTTALSDCYRDEENLELNMFPKLVLSNEEITDDMFAIVEAMYVFYVRITGDRETDLLGFSHLINRLVFQFINSEESEVSE